MIKTFLFLFLIASTSITFSSEVKTRIKEMQFALFTFENGNNVPLGESKLSKTKSTCEKIRSETKLLPNQFSTCVQVEITLDK